MRSIRSKARKPTQISSWVAVARVVVGAALLMACVMPVRAQTTPPQTAAQKQATALGHRIERGNEPDESGAVYGVATGVVDAPIARVLNTVVDYKDYASFMPHFKKSRELSRRGNNAILYLEVSILKGAKTLWTNAKVYERKPEGQTRIVEAKMVKGKGNMGQFAARWELTPVDAKRTLVHFKLIVDPDLPVPRGLIDEQNMKASSHAIKALRKKLGVAPK